MKPLTPGILPCVSCGRWGRINMWWDAAETIPAFICPEHHTPEVRDPVQPASRTSKPLPLPHIRKECLMCREEGFVNMWMDDAETVSAFLCMRHPTPQKGALMQHIIARQNDTKTLCGMDRDQAVQAGSQMCPECASTDRLIQDAIGHIRDPTKLGKVKEFMTGLSKAQVTTKETTKSMDYKASAVKALKRGASAGTMKVLSKKVKVKLTEKFPALAMVPQDLWNVLLCLAVNVTASTSPDLPGIKMIESLSQEAFEGLLTDVTSKMVQDVIETVSETVMELAEKKPGLLGES